MIEDWSTKNLIYIQTNMVSNQASAHALMSRYFVNVKLIFKTCMFEENRW